MFIYNSYRAISHSSLQTWVAFSSHLCICMVPQDSLWYLISKEEQCIFFGNIPSISFETVISNVLLYMYCKRTYDFSNHQCNLKCISIQLLENNMDGLLMKKKAVYNQYVMTIWSASSFLGRAHFFFSSLTINFHLVSSPLLVKLNTEFLTDTKPFLDKSTLRFVPPLFYFHFTQPSHKSTVKLV